MLPVLSKVMATVNAPYSVAVTPAQLAVSIADPESAVVCDHATFAFLSEVSLNLQYAFIDAMAVDPEKVALVARKFSDLAGYRLPLAS